MSTLICFEESLVELIFIMRTLGTHCLSCRPAQAYAALQHPIERALVAHLPAWLPPRPRAPPQAAPSVALVRCSVRSEGKAGLHRAPDHDVLARGDVARNVLAQLDLRADRVRPP